MAAAKLAPGTAPVCSSPPSAADALGETVWGQGLDTPSLRRSQAMLPESSLGSSLHKAQGIWPGSTAGTGPFPMTGPSEDTSSHQPSPSGVLPVPAPAPGLVSSLSLPSPGPGSHLGDDGIKAALSPCVVAGVRVQHPAPADGSGEPRTPFQPAPSFE